MFKLPVSEGNRNGILLVAGAAAVLMIGGGLVLHRTHAATGAKKVMAAKAGVAHPVPVKASMSSTAGKPVSRGGNAVAARPAAMQPAAAGVSKAAPPVQVAQAGMVGGPGLSLAVVLPNQSLYSYNPEDRRDPFQSLVKGDFEAEHGSGGEPLVDVGDLTLMGVMTSNGERLAMVEDSKQHGYTLRAGDPVLNGRVSRVEDNCIIVNLSSYGESQTVRLRLNNRRSANEGQSK